MKQATRRLRRLSSAGPTINLHTAFQYLLLNFVSASLLLFSSLALVVLKFPSRKLMTFRVLPDGKLWKVLELGSRVSKFNPRPGGHADGETE